MLLLFLVIIIIIIMVVVVAVVAVIVVVVAVLLPPAVRQGQRCSRPRVPRAARVSDAQGRECRERQGSAMLKAVLPLMPSSMQVT